MTLKPLDVEMAMEIAANLGARDRQEIRRIWPNLERWAHSRIHLNGVAYGLVHGKRTIVIFGVIFDGSVGTIWIAGREGWQRHVKHLLRVWRALRSDAQHLRLDWLRCRVCEDNEKARRFVEHLGFRRGDAADGLLSYGMAP